MGRKTKLKEFSPEAPLPGVVALSEEALHPWPWHRGEIGRSLEQDPNYRPEWRWIVIEKILKACLDEKNNVVKKAIPEDEKDDLIVTMCIWLQEEGYCIHREMKGAYDWAFSAYYRNGYYGSASHIKAAIVAGMKPHEIAEWLHTDTVNVEVFLSLFYDVKRYLHLPHFRSRLVFNGYSARCLTPMEARERFLLLVAYLQGRKQLIKTIQADIKLNKAELEEMAQIVRACLTTCAQNFALSLMGEPEPLPNHLEKYNEMIQTQAVADQFSSGNEAPKIAQFAKLLTSHLQKKAVELPNNSLLQQFNRLSTTHVIDADLVEDRPDFLLGNGSAGDLEEFQFEKASQPSGEIAEFDT